MDQKSWLWRKRSAEKTIAVANNGGEEETDAQPNRESTELEDAIKSLNEKLASAIDECSTKDELLQSYGKSSEDAKEDKLKAEAEIKRLSDELEKATTKYSNADEKLIQLNSALKESMEQLNLLRSQQQKTVEEAIEKANDELQRSCKKLEENLTESNKGLEILTVENSYLTKALIAKEKLFEDLKEKNSVEIHALMSRLDSVEKENAFVRYELRAMEKEFDVRNGEFERLRGNLEVVRKQRVESCKKVKKLEAEVSRLRDLNRSKRLSSTRYNYETTPRKKGGDCNKGDLLQSEIELLRERLVRKEEEISYLRTLTEKLEKSSISSKSIVEASDMSLMDDFLNVENKLAKWESPTENPNDEFDSIRASTIKIAELVDKLERNSTYAFFACKSADMRTLQELVSSCKNFSDGKIRLGKFVEDLTLIIARIVENSTPYEGNRCKVRDLFTKNLGEKTGPGTFLGLESVKKLMLEMENLHSTSQFEIESLKKELKSTIKSSGKGSNGGSENMLEELRQTYEDEMEDLKVMNMEIDTQLIVTKCKLGETIRRLSTVEAELDDKSRCWEELKGTCFDLQLQLERNQNMGNNGDRGDEEDLLHTGKKITKASEKLAECEEAMFKLGNHLKSLASARELSVVEKVINFTTDGNNTAKKKLNPRPSLRDRLLSVDGKNVTEDANTYPKSRASIVVGKKQSGGFGFLKKLIFRRKNNLRKSSVW